MRARVVPGLAVIALLAGALPPAPALAHGLVGRADLPIPEWLFGWAAATVLILSFVALAALWPQPKLEADGWRPLPAGLGRFLASPAFGSVCGAVGVLLLAVVLWSGLFGRQHPTENFAPTFIYVVFWLGLIPASVLFGDVFRAFNPWRAIGRSFAWVAERLARKPLPASLPYPERLGRWPAAVGIFAFAWMEIVATNGDAPRALAIATLLYSGLTFLGMGAYGVERWIERGEAFSVYFNLFSRLSVFERRGGEVGLRRPLSGLAALEPMPGTVALVAVMIGSVTFDGASTGPAWQSLVPTVGNLFRALGLAAAPTIELTFGLGLLLSVVLIYGFYRLGIAGARSVGGDLTAAHLSRAFVHSLVPIALVYAAAHYVSLLLLQGPAIVPLASDPLGSGWDLFGTAGQAVDYGLLAAATFWYIQVALVIAGHVAALTLAHDRAPVVYDRAWLAARSQYWMLAVMVGFTSLALWLLSRANSG